ncbi:MAG: UDP-N-acetylmuramoyl-L-alanyl-D-glutamate--2,6-diaminopimelate ligase, partial [Xanthomonadales bacterium]|nr:UDP-N-acetylmuramoyl-L-alanyl-D-glutamate--2,6-diaminopimelate ligase [Xanthomonadales bacterium]
MSLRLDQLLAGVAHVPPTMLTGLSLDSRRIKTGDTFVALRRHRSHGLAFAGEALRRGAGSIVFEPPAPADLPVPEGAIAVPDLRTRLGSMADQFFGSPSQSLRVVGVTGTNGKTSTVQLLAQALSGEGRCVGTIGTLGLGLVGAMHAGERTTPDVIAVHSELSAMRAEGAQDVAMEVSSHALDQGRVDAVRFEVAVFTNLTRDHLDYHHSMQAYGEAKARLFAWPGLKAAVINLDDAFGRQLAMTLDESVQLIGVSSREAPSARLQAKAITRDASGLLFDLVDGAHSVTVKSRLLGRFNVDNLLAVAGVLVAMDWSLERIAAQLAQLDPVSGRMNRIGGDATHPLVVVDYAHTPDA